MTLRDVVLGGWISYVTSLCQSSSFEKAVLSGRRAASLYTTIIGLSADLRYNIMFGTDREPPRDRAPWGWGLSHVCGEDQSVSQCQAVRECSILGL